jgi:hypothetical protein
MALTIDLGYLPSQYRYGCANPPTYMLVQVPTRITLSPASFKPKGRSGPPASDVELIRPVTQVSARCTPHHIEVGSTVGQNIRAASLLHLAVSYVAVKGASEYLQDPPLPSLSLVCPLRL